MTDSVSRSFPSTLKSVHSPPGWTAPYAATPRAQPGWPRALARTATALGLAALLGAGCTVGVPPLAEGRDGGGGGPDDSSINLRTDGGEICGNLADDNGNGIVDDGCPCTTDGPLQKLVGCALEVQVFSQSGAWRKPQSGTFVEVSCWGGGGGGGGGRNDNPDSSGGGGGGAALSTRRIPMQMLPATVVVEIGQGGTGGGVEQSGADGEDSTFGAFLTAGGGRAGGGSGGPGGEGGAGDLAGTPGSNGIPGSNANGAAGGDAASAEPECGTGGAGGINGVVDGTPGTAPGGGGGGGASRAGSLVGGDGAPGFCVAIVS